MDCFKKIEALIDTAGADAVAEARALLGQFEGKSDAFAIAADDFLLELMTLVFLSEAGRDAVLAPARRLAHKRLAKVKRLAPALKTL